jgi:hypothetical protein
MRSDSAEYGAISNDAFSSRSGRIDGRSSRSTNAGNVIRGWRRPRMRSVSIKTPIACPAAINVP